jgi:hypothetical protein
VAQEVEIRRIEVRSHPRQIVCETLPQNTSSQKRAGGVTQGVGPEFKLRDCKKKKLYLTSGITALNHRNGSSIGAPISRSISVLFYILNEYSSYF